jgi:hypothetical protein
VLAQRDFPGRRCLVAAESLSPPSALSDVRDVCERTCMRLSQIQANFDEVYSICQSREQPMQASWGTFSFLYNARLSESKVSSMVATRGQNGKLHADTKTFRYAADHGIIRSLPREQKSLTPSSMPFSSHSFLMMRLKHCTRCTLSHAEQTSNRDPLPRNIV